MTLDGILDKARPTHVGNWVARLTPTEILALAASGAETDADLGWAEAEAEVSSPLMRHVYFTPSPSQLIYLETGRG